MIRIEVTASSQDAEGLLNSTSQSPDSGRETTWYVKVKGATKDRKHESCQNNDDLISLQYHWSFSINKTKQDVVDNDSFLTVMKTFLRNYKNVLAQECIDE